MIRDVPDDVRDALAARAAEAGQSLQDFLMGVVVREASYTQSRALIADLDSWTTGTGATADDVLDVQAAARSERPGSAWIVPEHWHTEVLSVIRGLWLGQHHLLTRVLASVSTTSDGIYAGQRSKPTKGGPGGIRTPDIHGVNVAL